MKHMAKAIFTGATVILAVLFCSCSKDEVQKPKIDGDFTFTAQINYSEHDYEADITRKSDVWELSYTSPDSLNGMDFTLENEKLTIDFDGISVTGQRENLPETSIPSLISKVIDNALNDSSAKAEIDGENIIVSGVVDGADYKVTFKNKIPLLIEISGNEFEVKISDFKKI